MPTPQAYQRLAERLAADATPVGRVWRPAERLGVWLAVGVLVFLGCAHWGLRRDLGERLRDLTFVLEVGLLFSLAGLVAAASLASGVPGREPGRRRFILTMLLAAAVWLIPIGYPAETDVPLGRFLELALACERRTMVLALLPLAALLVPLRRAAPLAATTAGALAGAAAFLLAAANMRLACPADHRFHLLIGHSLPAGVGIGFSATIGAIWLGRWRRRGTGRLWREAPDA